MAYEYLKDQKEAEVSGFCEEIRLLGNLAFVIIRKREGTMQLIFKKKENPDAFEAIKGATIESYISAKGIILQNAQARNGFELNVTEARILSKAGPLPLDVSGKIESEMKNRFDNRFLDIRTKKNQNIFLLRSKIIGYVNEYFQKDGYIAINTPKLTVTGAESGAELFKVDYFGRVAYLAQSPQEYKQMAISGGFEKVYEIGSVFRAEKSNTTRHLTEFIGLDVEVSDVYKVEQICHINQEMFKYVISKLEQNNSDLLKEMGISFNVPDEFPIITFDQALKILNNECSYKIDDKDLDSKGEKLLGDYFLNKHKSDFVFVINYPIEAKPFYHMYNEDNKTTKSFDLLYKGQEITSGAIREHRAEEFVKNVLGKGLDPNTMPEYVDIFKYGVPPHGGMGMGLDRIVQKMANIDNVKEVVLFPRDPERLTP